MDWLRHRGTPVVTVDQAPTTGVPAVNVDDAGGARVAAQHLLDLGHRNIGILTVKPTSTVASGRPPRGARLARSTGPRPGWYPLFGYATPRPVTAAYDAALTLLDRPDRPTAVLCFSDVFAAQAVRAAEALGLNVPEDLSVSATTTPTSPRLFARAHHGAPTGRREGPRRGYCAARAH